MPSWGLGKVTSGKVIITNVTEKFSGRGGHWVRGLVQKLSPVRFVLTDMFWSVLTFRGFLRR